MNAIVQLIQAYRKYGIEVSTGLNPNHFYNYEKIPFTYFFAEGKPVTPHVGVALLELYFFEALFKVYHPERIFGIGNGHGWSSLALGLLNPDAKVVTLDACRDAPARDGLKLTTNIARDLGLNVHAVMGVSPDAVPSIIEEKFNDKVDFFLLDGLHKNKAQQKDFRACLEHAKPESIFVLHNIINSNLHASFVKVTQEHGLNIQLLWRTPSGMGVAYPASTPQSVLDVIDAFSSDMNIIKTMARQAKSVALKKVEQLSSTSDAGIIVDELLEKVKAD